MPGPSTDPALRRTVLERLSAADQRFTANRERLVSVLAGAGRPLTIPEIRDASPEIPVSSAYRNLTVLEQVGVVHRVVTHDEHARYELAEDLTEHHHHLVCTSCGGVEDVPASATIERSMRAAADEISRQRGFKVEHHRIDLVGLCRDCA